MFDLCINCFRIDPIGYCKHLSLHIRLYLCGYYAAESDKLNNNFGSESVSRTYFSFLRGIRAQKRKQKTEKKKNRATPKIAWGHWWSWTERICDRLRLWCNISFTWNYSFVRSIWFCFLFFDRVRCKSIQCRMSVCSSAVFSDINQIALYLYAPQGRIIFIIYS